MQPSVSTILQMAGILLLFLLILLLTFFLFRKRARYPYRACPLLTPREYRFYQLLVRETSHLGILICPKVGLKELMEVTDRRHYRKYFAPIAQKHLDFVLCDRQLQVICAIELDDRSHDSEEAQKRDYFKDHAMKAAGISLYRIREFDQTAVRELCRRIRQAEGRRL